MIESFPKVNTRRERERFAQWKKSFEQVMITELWCENNINQKKLMSFESEAQKIPTVKTNF